MNRSRTARTVSTASAVALALAAVTGLAGCGAAESPVSAEVVERSINKFEHEAHRQLVEMREQAGRNINPREHLGRAGQ